MCFPVKPVPKHKERRENYMEKSRMYQLYELRDEIKKALINSQTVENSERKLVKIILESKEEKEFADFIKSLSSNWKQYEHDRLELNTRLEKINKLISYHEKQDDNSKLVDEIVSLTLEALGAVKSEKKK